MNSDDLLPWALVGLLYVLLLRAMGCPWDLLLGGLLVAAGLVVWAHRA